MERIQVWQLDEPGKALTRLDRPVRAPGPDEVVVRIAGCGICHTDISFLDGEVRPRAGFPLVLGHEIAGTVVQAGEGAGEWEGRDVVVPAVLPCGECALCTGGRANACSRQVMPGNDCDGGFATHATLPARGLAAVDTMPEGHRLADFAVIADAVSTALQAVRRARVSEGDFVVVVGAGGVGTYAVQVAAVSGATVVAIDVDADRLAPLAAHGAKVRVNAAGRSTREVRDEVRSIATDLDHARLGWKVFECSGTPAGQRTAFSLLVQAGTLAVVGFTREPVEVRLSNLMALDADAFGSWGCPPDLYPEAVRLVQTGRIALAPFTRHVPMDSIESALAEARSGSVPRRLVLIP